VRTIKIEIRAIKAELRENSPSAEDAEQEEGGAPSDIGPGSSGQMIVADETWEGNTWMTEGNAVEKPEAKCAKGAGTEEGPLWRRLHDNRVCTYLAQIQP
jgi:hypothetical protein